MRSLVLTGHYGQVTAVAWSNHSAQIATGSRDGFVRVWNARTGECMKVLRGHTNIVSCVAWSPDLKWIASGSKDNCVRLWTNHPWKQDQILEGHSGTVTCITWLGATRLLSGSEDCTMRIWDARTGRPLSVAATGFRSGFVAIGNWQNKVASMHLDNTLRVWTDGPAACETFNTGAGGQVANAAVSPDCKHVAFVSYPLAQAAGQRTVHCCHSYGHPSVAFSAAVNDLASLVDCVAWSADSKQLIMGTCDGLVLICDVATGNLVRRINNRPPGYAFGSAVLGMAMSPDSTRLAAAIGCDVQVLVVSEWSDKRNKLFDPETRRIVFTLMCVRQRLQSMSACLPVMPVLPMEMWLEVLTMLP